MKQGRDPSTSRCGSSYSILEDAQQAVHTKAAAEAAAATAAAAAEQEKQERAVHFSELFEQGLGDQEVVET